ncbi:MAG: single-stranded DNA-binding protein [Kiritimatiellia bacterium]
MSSLNSVILAGNLTRDVETRKTPSGALVGDLGVAVSDDYKDKDGQLVKRTCFTDIVVWGRQAETCAQYLRKGSSVLVEGRLQLDQWKNDKGENRSKLRIRANRVQFIGRPAGIKAGETEVPGKEVAEDNLPF